MLVNKEDKIEVGTEVVEGKKVLYVLKREKQYQLDSLYNENIILEKWHQQFVNKNYRSRYLLFGFGNGMFVRKILENITEDSVVIVVEPSKAIFDKVKEEWDISDILQNKQVHIILNEDKDEISFRELLAEYLDYNDLLGAIKRSYLNYPILFEKEYNDFEDTIKFQTNLLSANNSFYSRLGLAIFYDVICNYPFMVKSKSIIDLNKKLPKDIPAILVAAGPSLDKNIKELTKAKNRSFILATDSAAKMLVKNDILPDMIMTIDPKKLYYHFDEKQIREIPLLCSLHSTRELLEIHNGDKYFYHDGNPYIEELFEKFQKMLPTIEGGGSVATDAFAMLERLQFETIILVGQDLAYSDNKTHASQTVRGEENSNIFSEDTLMVEGIDGEMIITSYEFQIYLDWFVEEIKKNKQYRVIDATEGGAKIKGTEIKTLSQAIEDECKREVDIEAILKNVVYRLTDSEQAEFINHMHQLPERFKKMRLIVCEALKIYKNMLKLVKNNKYRDSKFNKMFQRVAKMSEIIETVPEYYFVNCFFQEQLGRRFDQGLGDIYANKTKESEELEEAMRLAIKYYDLLLYSIDRVSYETELWLEIAEDSKRRIVEILPEEARKLVDR